MTVDRWELIKTVFGRALDIPEPERGSYLDAVCREDAELRREAEQLLAQSDEPSLRSPAADFLVSGAGEAVAYQASAGTRRSTTGGAMLTLGDVLSGQFVITTLLGSGGMGEVYLASDRKLHRRVAIKVLPAPSSARHRI